MPWKIQRYTSAAIGATLILDVDADATRVAHLLVFGRSIGKFLNLRDLWLIRSVRKSHIASQHERGRQ